MEAAAQTAMTAKAPGGALDPRLSRYGSLMDDAPVQASDILMPAMLFMQPTSKLVTEEKARAGQIVESLGNKPLADKGALVEVIPFGFHKTVVTFKEVNGKQEYVGVEPYTAANATRPREEFKDGEKFRNFETINYFVLLPSDIANGNAIPYLVRFRSTGYVTGKTMETFRARLAEFGKPHCFSTFKLGTKYVENPKGKFYVPTVAEGRDTTDAELKVVEHWQKMVKEGKAKADDSDLKAAAADTAPNDQEFSV